jgi:hypothetical protein
MIGRKSISLADVSRLLSYNQETGEFRWKLNRGRKAKAGSIAGTVQKLGYRVIVIEGSTYKAHRLAWLFVHGHMPPEDVDHIDGNRSNNAISNLRLATRAENMQNLSEPKNGLPRGVHVTKYGFQARIQHQFKRLSLGFYKTVDEAYQAYLAAKKDLHAFQPTPRYEA